MIKLNSLMRKAALKKPLVSDAAEVKKPDISKAVAVALKAVAENNDKPQIVSKTKVRLVVRKLLGASAYREEVNKNPIEDLVKSPHNLKKTAEKYGVSEASIEDIYKRIMRLEDNTQARLGAEDVLSLRNEMASLRSMPDFGRLNDIDEIRQSLSSIENRIESGAVGAGDRLREAEIERDSLVKAKDEIEKKYYKREVDEPTFKKMMSDYEQQLIKTQEKIKSYRAEGVKVGLPQPRVDMNKVFEKYARGFKAVYFPVYPQAPVMQMTQPQPQPQQTTDQLRPIFAVESRSIIIPKSAADGIEIPDKAKPPPIDTEEAENIMNVNVVYPLIPRVPAKGEMVYSYTNIRWDQQENGLLYNVFEPALTPEEKRILSKSKELLEERLNMDLRKLRKAEAVSYLMRQTDDVFSLMGVKLGQKRIDVLKYYIRRDFAGLERIEPLMNDPNLEDISCDGTNIPIYVFHRNPLIGSIRTNIKFPDQKSLDTFAVKLAQRAGKTISVAEPLLDGTLTDGSRVQATLGTDIARRGSNFTIRKFTDVPLTPIDMLNYGTINATALAYLWLAVENGKSVLIGGSTASGKTTLLNVLSLFIKPTKKIVSIEDTPELRLPHPHWVPEVARTAISDVGNRKIGEVDMFDLLKESLRQRPDYIIVGEVRGKEAYVLFQQMASGHPGMSTIHADSISKLVDRLTTPPISLPGNLIQNLDILIFSDTTTFKSKNIRKIDTIMEITGYENGAPVGNTVFKWDPAKSYLRAVGRSAVLKKIAYSGSMPEKSVQQEISNRVKVLEWMQERGINDFSSVARIFSMYNSDPDKILNMVE
ncbi:MAG: Flp pilus assembly complex ATPase component TadA [Candidatus Aenigmarchaeota archaeon]|nr:Flp pilus assembly complex ATPase component TadA [Candidatus Aenigmarchaeota archaeon]